MKMFSRLLVVVAVLIASTVIFPANAANYLTPAQEVQQIAHLIPEGEHGWEGRKVDTRAKGWLRGKAHRTINWAESAKKDNVVASAINTYKATHGNVWQYEQTIAGGDKYGVAIGKTTAYSKAVPRAFTLYGYRRGRNVLWVISPKFIAIGYYHRFGKGSSPSLLESEVLDR